MKKIFLHYFSSDTSYKQGFALPALIIISTTLMIISAAVLQGTLSVKTSLDNQYYDQLAKEAAEAGIAYANACVAAGAIVYDNSGPLRGDTDCEGERQRGDQGFVVYDYDNKITSQFSTSTTDIRADGSIAFKSTGILERSKRIGGVFRSHVATVSQSTGVVGARLKAKKVVASARTHFVIASDGFVYGSGGNSSGQLGLGDTTDRSTPTRVPIKDASGKDLKVIDVVAGDFTTYFLTDDYSIYATGENYNGQLGTGNTTLQRSPVKMTLRDPSNNIITARSITSNGYTAYIIGSDNYVYGVGGNNYGKLGIGSTTNQLLPVRMNLRNPSNVALTAKSVVMSGFSTYIIASDDFVYAVGHNGSGQLGNGTTTNQATPVRVNLRNPSNVAITTRQVYAADNYQYAFFIGSDDFVYSVGSNVNGELGINSTTWLSTPQRMQLRNAGGNSITATNVSIGDATYVTGSDGYLYATGPNDGGQLGVGTTTRSLVPVQVQLKDSNGIFLKALSVKAHLKAASVIASDGSAYVFGQNPYAGLGLGTTNSQNLPARISPAGASGNNRIRDILVWDQAMFFVNTDYTIYAAGYNYGGKLGTGTTTDQLMPQPVLLPVMPQNDQMSKIYNGSYSTLALATDGSVYASGVNQFGQLGLDSAIYRAITPARVQLKDSTGKFLSGQDIFCNSIGWGCFIIASDGNGYAMGNNSVGQLGIGNTTNQNKPTRMIIKDAANRDVMPVSIVGSSFIDVDKASTYIIGADGYVYVTGRNDFGQLGIGTTVNQSTPVRMNLRDSGGNLLTARKVAVNAYAAYILASDNNVYSVGRNNVGQLGIGSTANQSTPVRMNLPTTAVDVVADDYSVFAIGSNGQIYGTGNNNGTLGNGSAATATSPVQMNLRDPSNAVLTAKSIATDGYATFIIGSDDFLYATGSNERGQLGLGDTAQRYTPVRVNLRNSGGAAITAVKAYSFGVAGALLVIGSDNYVYASGWNEYGQLGVGTSNAGEATPLRVQLKDSTGTFLRAKDATIEHLSGYFISSDNRAYASGLNDNGQLGVGDQVQKTTPQLFRVPVISLPGTKVTL